MRTYESTMAEIQAIAAEQRAIVEKAEPSTDDKDFLLKAEGEIGVLRALADELHEREVAELKDASMRAVGGIPAPESRHGDSAVRELLRSMTPNQEVEIRSWASNTGSGSYMVGQEWHDTVESYRFEANWMRQAGAMVVRTESTHNIPVLTSLSTPTIVGDNTAYTASDPTVESVILYAYKLTDKVLVSEELLADATYDVAGLLARAMGMAFGKAELGYCMVGTGSNQPTGIFKKSSDLTLDSSTAISNDEIIEIVYGLGGEYRDGAVFMMDNTTAFKLATNKVDISTSGSQPFAWPTLQYGQDSTLLGYPVKLASAIANFVTGNKIIAFGNPNQYVIGERGPLTIKRLVLNEYADTFAFSQRYDGKPLNPAAFYVAQLA